MEEMIRKQAADAVRELIEIAKLEEGSILVVGCSTSEIIGEKIGTDSRPPVADEVYEAIAEVLAEKKIYLAAQCCEHLNRALIVEKELYDREIRFLCTARECGAAAEGRRVICHGRLCAYEGSGSR